MTQEVLTIIIAAIPPTLIAIAALVTAIRNKANIGDNARVIDEYHSYATGKIGIIGDRLKTLEEKTAKPVQVKATRTKKTT